MKVALKLKFASVLVLLILLSDVVEAGRFYVVIGTFGEEAGAAGFANSLKDQFREAGVRFDANGGVYHVYAMETDRKQEAEDFRHYLRKENGFLNAWVLTDLNSAEASDEPDEGLSNSSVMLELYTGGAVLLGSDDKRYFSINRNQGQIMKSVRGGSADGFTFIVETPRGVEIPAKVMLMNNAGVPVSTFKTGEFVSFAAKQRNQILALVCEVPGYNPEMKMVALSDPASTRGVVLDSTGVWEVRFRVTRSKINEIDFLYRDIFHANAAVFGPKAKKPMQVLLALMQANPGWTVEINSHCNAGDKREIMLPEKGSYFEISGATRRSGSDKQLTRARAETLRDYLVENGIESRRITIMGWGSLDMLVKDENGDLRMNERVEVSVQAGV